mmetsp:Transcript_18524/g.17839  ORF Transcript_18524/g.17839 Transcript_18524/m.17839 type:complete len:762 (+) Transcript_18524:127-2412(+)|eukprot:CAMPEP_0119035738 /NCGR_PEP_ID=MMETSP1177-20130426/2942_1 /TAXON_ID=2985 /ORGANISM="Ochromonas sp, Strain CCMP1899" /LENGTH=761 /DNA_ID=CAMNT_0006994441 /DNA_START=117 /DNA_END=2402 /DNA_ORIENTATION=-
MDQLIPVINKLQDVFGAIGQQAIDLPQIVVVGSQSAGKSSVLENIVGRDFLPRSSGICTRRPLVLQLYTINPVESNDDDAEKGEEWGEFLHLPNKRFYDFAEIRKEIEKETERLTGKNKGISNVSINLKIFSPYVLNLTLVDLPGITKVPTGDQPEDVEEQVRSMCYEFISNPNAIILAVTAANQDIVNSDGLKMARSVDPEGLRTVGVLTKVDIMDQGTDCTDVLGNRVVPLRRGYIAVVNRSQKDINDELPIRQGLVKEQKFFQSHPKYRDMLAKCGTTNLARSLNQILMMHIRDCLPDIKSRVMSMMASVQGNIDALGSPPDSQGASKLGGILLQTLSKYASSVSNSVDGRGTPGGPERDDLYGGARISYIFNEVFVRTMRALDPFEGLDDEDIRVAIANANGSRPSLFVPEISFDLLARRQIARLEHPGLRCVDLAFDEMQRMAFQCETQELSRFPELRDRVFEIVAQSLKDCLVPTQKMISNLIQIELAYINTSHPDFIGGKQAVSQLNRKLNTPEIPKNLAEAGVTGVPVAPSTPTQGNGASFQSGQGFASSSSSKSNGVKSNNGTPSAAPPTAPTTAGIQVGTSNQGFLGIFKGRDPVVQNRVLGGGPAGMSPAAVSDNTGFMTAGLGSKMPGGALVKLPAVPEKMRSNIHHTDKEKVETEIIKALISSYYDIVKKNYMDLVPKTIMHFLVNNFKEGLQNELVSQLYREDVIGSLMKETDEVASRRKACTEMQELLQTALEILNEVRDFNTFKA